MDQLTRNSAASEAALEPFHPLVRDWFLRRVGRPTAIQSLAWPVIAAGEHVLISAPTGSGKTLTAFLWALDRLFTGAWEAGRTRVLYISPLRALNADIRRNLEEPLAALWRRFDQAARETGREVPRIQVLTRSGDTPQGERRKMLRHPPEILVTTPESLNILLTSAGGRGLLDGLQAVILDEIHAVFGSKRGTHLITAIDRLVPLSSAAPSSAAPSSAALSGEFQRIALSATVRPMDKVAEFVGGYRIRPATEGGEPLYEPRRVKILRSADQKRYQVEVRFPLAKAPDAQGTADLEGGVTTTRRDAERRDDDGTWDVLTEDFRRVIQRNRSTLLFANSRRTTEKVTRLINAQAGAGGGGELAYSHHGSLSREVRTAVESRLKEGTLKAIVATNSLELGIDIGSLDEVLLVQTPRSMASAIQRVGRAGHGVGEVSRGVFFPTDGRDLLEAAVVARAVVEQEIESAQSVTAPLDVLAQVILSMTCAEPWPLDDLFHQLRTSTPYRHLPRKHYDLVLDMLAGRYADSRVRELRPCVLVDRVRGVVKARKGQERLIYLSGGTIADRGYFALRQQDTMAKLGELDEEFVWERSVGDIFTLGAQSWRIQRITHNDVLVRPARSGGNMAPFWRADADDRSFDFCRKVAGFLERAEGRLGRPEFLQELRTVHHLDEAASNALRDYLLEQKAATGGHLPRTDRVLLERVGGAVSGVAPGHHQVVVHSWWGGKVHRPLALAFRAAWNERHAEPLEIFHDDACMLLRLPEDVDVAEVFALVSPEQVEELLRAELETSGFFGSRFRWAAQTSMLLPKAGFRQRTPLWLNRQRSKKLLDSVSAYGDFPVVIETWRTCLRDEFELDAAKEVLSKVRSGELPLETVSTTSPSPLAANLVWQYTNQYMYEDDSAQGEGLRGGGLRADVLRELVYSSDLRPMLPEALVADFESKAKRTAAGYAPAPGDELALWLEERVLIAEVDWHELLRAVERDHEVAEAEILDGLIDRAARVTLPSAGIGAVAALGSVVRLAAALGKGAEMPTIRSLRGGRLPAATAERLRILKAARRRDPDEDDTAAELGLAPLVAEALRSTGPIDLEVLGELWGTRDDGLADLLETLKEASGVVIDRLVEGIESVQVCDAENLEILLRRLRLDQRPSFEALSADYLPLFLAHHQGLTEQGAGMEALQERLENLFGRPARADMWETEILPARLRPYYPSWLDSAMQSSELLWVGTGTKKLTFGFESDLELFFDAPASPEGEDDGLQPEDLFGPNRRRIEFQDAVRQAGRSAAEVQDRLWQLAWQGRVSHDSFLPVRRGLTSGFETTQVAQPVARHASSTRHARGTARNAVGRRGRWNTGTVIAGAWRRLDATGPESNDGLDILAREELGKDRVRLLLQRWGVIFRQLLERELPALRWSKVFRALRLMELSGEVLAGHFFRGIQGLQFISHGAFRDLIRGLPEDAVYSLCAADPASLCGVDIEGLKEALPARRPSTHLVFLGRELVLISRRRGKDLELRVGVEHPRLLEFFAPLENLLTREVEPMSSVVVETVGGEPASGHPLSRQLESLFRVTREGASLRLWKRY